MAGILHSPFGSSSFFKCHLSVFIILLKICFEMVEIMDIRSVWILEMLRILR